MLTRILYISPIFLAILFSRYLMCSFHDKLSSNKRNFRESEKLQRIDSFDIMIVYF